MKTRMQREAVAAERRHREYEEMGEAICRFVQAFWAERNFGPSIAEIARGLGIQRSLANRHVGYLVWDGRLLREEGNHNYLARTLRVP